MHYPPVQQAEGLVTAKWVNALTQFGYDVRVFSMNGVRIPKAPLERIKSFLFLFTSGITSILRYDTFDLTQFPQLYSYTIQSLEDFKRQHSEQPFDIIVSRYEPIASAICGFWAKMWSGLPWIASYGDPIPRIGPQRTGVKGMVDRHRNGFQRNWTYRLLTTPNKLVFPNDYLRDSILEKVREFGVNASQKLVDSAIIPHVGGPLNATITGTEQARGEVDTITIRYLGYLSAVRDLSTFLAALQIWDTTSDTLPLRVEFIGNIAAWADEIRGFQSQKRHKITCEIIEQVSADEAFKLMQRADICLLIEQPNSVKSIFLPSKFCDYAAAKSPILAITAPSGPVQEYLKAYGGGIAVVHGDVNGTYQALRRLAEGKTIGTQRLSNQFSPMAVSKAWEEVFAEFG